MRKLSLLGILGLFVFATIATQLQLFTSSAFAATRTQSANLTGQAGGDTPLGGGVTFGNVSDNSTGITPTNEYYVYAWDVDLTQPPCTNAQLTGLHIIADTVADTEGDPDGVTLAVMTDDGGGATPLLTYSPPVSGQDSGTGIGRLNTSTPNPPTILDLGIAGPLETTWDLTGYDTNDPLSIVVSHDAQDGTVGEQTTLSTVELTYDDANCVYDGAIQKTLLNADSVKPGGQAVYEITVTNKGNEPLPFNAQEDRGIYDLPSKSLSYQSVESSDVDVECQDAGDLGTLFGGDPNTSLPYQNHLDYHMVLCSSQSSALIPPGESWSYRLTFDVASDATNITNFVSWVLITENWVDPDMVAVATAATSLTPGGQDMIDLLLSGAISADIVSVVSHDFTAAGSASARGDTLAYTGQPMARVGIAGVAVLLSGGFILQNKRRSYRGV
ncbi:hypothetical protein KC957_03985 [Candidatus Saccharibacteria bacterium]|nr:hypothetical protein [Candidatus Saccharibacteria bacterium]